MTAPSGCFIERVQRVDCGETVVDVAICGDDTVFVLGEEALVFVTAQGTQRRVPLHAGAILSSAQFGGWVITGGDDGRVLLTDAAGNTRVIHADHQARWIDCVALNRSGAAWSVGRRVFFREAGGEFVAYLDRPSSIGGISVSPDGHSLAIAHYNGVTVWRPLSGEIQTLEWKGSHHSPAFSPNGAIVVTRMLEPALHGWRLYDGKQIPMPSYGNPVRCFSWIAGSKWLAAGGSHYLTLWPFHQFEHPMSGVPLRLCGYRAQSTVVAAHPTSDVVAVGYEDGMALLIRIDDESEILLKNASGTPVKALAWNEPGTRLAIVCENGTGRIIDLTFTAQV